MLYLVHLGKRYRGQQDRRARYREPDPGLHNRAVEAAGGIDSAREKQQEKDPSEQTGGAAEADAA
jgi:hypothetical protein